MKIKFAASCLNPFFALFLTCLTVSELKGQSIERLKDSIDAVLFPWKNFKEPGISITVVKRGQVVYSNSLGMANIKANTANDSATTFWLASVSKQFTAAAIYQLALQKKLNLDSSVRLYLPQLPALFQDITVDHLVHHTSGMRDGFVLTALAKNPPAAYTNKNVLHYLSRSKKLNFSPGTFFEYNNSGYVLLAAIIERISQKSYPAYMKEHLFVPLGMTHTYVSPSFPTDNRQAEGYQKNGASAFQKVHFPGNTYGSTGVISTLADLTRWAQFLQVPGVVPALADIAPLLLQTGRLQNKKKIAYAGGLEKFAYGGRILYEHFGADEGFKADLLFFPGTAVTIIGLTNNSSYFGLQNLLFQISDFVHQGQRSWQPLTNQSATVPSISYYYNSSVPQLKRIQRLSDHVAISSTPTGHAMPFQAKGDTLRSVDPIPTVFLQRKHSVAIIDTYYHNSIQLDEVQPVVQKDDLLSFCGNYYSEELETSYKIRKTERGLQLEFAPGVTFDLFRITNTDFIFDYQGSNILQFTKAGFLFSREGCRKLLFEKK